MSGLTKHIKLNSLLEFALGINPKQKTLTPLLKFNSSEILTTELDIIEKSLEWYSHQHRINPPSNLKSKILKKCTSLPPILTSKSKIENYQLWLDKTNPPKDYESMHMEVIGDYETAKMVIAWIKEGETNHLHTEYSENFLIVEGSCTATINGKTANYSVGDYVHFPVNQNHSYKITSKIPMKVIACLDFLAA